MESEVLTASLPFVGEAQPAEEVTRKPEARATSLQVVDRQWWGEISGPNDFRHSRYLPGPSGALRAKLLNADQ